MFVMKLVKHLLMKLSYLSKRSSCHLPLSNWLYIKIYTNSTFCEGLLVNELYNLLLNKMDNAFYEKMFFIKYNDPQRHIKLRFYNSQKVNNLNILDSICEVCSKYLQSYEISNIQVDTYKQEIFRFGTNLEKVEDIFYLDSVACLYNLKSILPSENESTRIYLLFYCISEYLQYSCVEYSVLERNILLSVNSYTARLKVTKKEHILINDKFREIKVNLNKLWSGNRPKEAYKLLGFVPRTIFNLGSYRDSNISYIHTDYSEILSSKLLFEIIHMHTNRVSKYKNVENEYLVLLYIYKIIKSTKSRV